MHTKVTNIRYPYVSYSEVIVVQISIRPRLSDMIHIRSSEFVPGAEVACGPSAERLEPDIQTWRHSCWTSGPELESGETATKEAMERTRNSCLGRWWTAAPFLGRQNCSGDEEPSQVLLSLHCYSAASYHQLQLRRHGDEATHWCHIHTKYGCWGSFVDNSDINATKNAPLPWNKQGKSIPRIISGLFLPRCRLKHMKNIESGRHVYFPTTQRKINTKRKGKTK